ncbi:MAG: FtsQ-type POTRA domain-containing protein [Deltaproteobacteria bacterium]|nr:FtsQ-type POTRA domain-containing protein [Deltaproteobacteria bacterium]
MKATNLKSTFETKKYRLRRRLKNTTRECLKAVLLAGIILTLGVAMIYGYNCVISLPYFQIRETVVRGCKELTEKDILSLASIRPSHNLLAINSEAINRKIMTNPWIRKVYIGRELPNRLVIVVRERTAAALVKKRDDLFLMDTEGTVFKKLEPCDDADLPVLTGCFNEGNANIRLLEKSLEFLRFLAASTVFPTMNHVSEINCHEVFGFSLFTDNGLCLLLGFDSYENKLKRLGPILADLERKNPEAKFLRIDASDPTKITVQRKNITRPAGTGDREKEYKT